MLTRNRWQFRLVLAIQTALQKAGLKLKDLDLIKSMKPSLHSIWPVRKSLALIRAIGNVNGGAIALGHPLAASGTRITLTLVNELQRRGGKDGVSAVCIGGGQGIASIWGEIIGFKFISESCGVKGNCFEINAFTKDGVSRIGSIVEDKVIDLHLSYQSLLESAGKIRAKEIAEAFVPA